MRTPRGRVNTVQLRILNYFYFTARPLYISPLAMARRRWQRHARKELEDDHDLIKLLDEVRPKSGSTGSDMGDYVALLRWIGCLEPTRVLECGSGLSTLVIAHALRKQHEAGGRRGVVVSMDESQEYSDQARRLLPDSLRPYVEFHTSPRLELLYRRGGAVLPGVRYRELPSPAYDFVYIDGPTERSRPGAVKCFNADILHVAVAAPEPVHALLDQRITTYLALKRLMPSARIKYRPTRTLTEVRAFSADTNGIEIAADHDAAWVRLDGWPESD